MKNTPHPNPHPAAYSVVPQGAREQEASPFDLAAFVAQFPLFARAPNGIANLRALILQLAVQGKLTEQNADENAKITLNTIKNCQQNRIASQEIRQQKPLPKVRDDEKSFTIPSNWVWTRLNDWGVWGSGATPKRDHAALYGGNIPWFKSGELTGGIITVSEEYITEKALKESAVKLHLKGTVLLAMYGATIGKTAILGIDATTNQAVCGCQCYDGIFNSYLLVLLKAYNSYFSSQGAGGAQPNISREKIIVTPVPLPPLEEQQRIVAKVDELMALCDQLEAQQDDQARNLLEANTAAIQAVTKTPIPNPSPARGDGSEDAQENAELLSPHPLAGGGLGRGGDAWQRIATHFNTLYGTNLPLPSDMRRGKLKDRTVALENVAVLRSLILKLAVTGKLVSFSEKDGLLDRLRQKRNELVSEKKIKRYDSSTIDSSSIPMLPKHWEFARLGEITEISSGSTPLKGRGDFYENGTIPWLTSTVTSEKIVRESDTFITQKAIDECGLTLYPKGSLLMAMYGQGKTRGQITEIDFDATINQACAAIVFFEGFHSIKPFVRLCLENLYDDLRALADGGAQPNLNGIKVKATVIPLPPLAEQHRIVAQVDELMALCDTLETLLTEQRQVAADFSAAAVQAMGGSEQVGVTP